VSALLADDPFTSVADALERLEGAVSPLAGVVMRTVSATHTTDEASLPNCAAELCSARRMLGAPTVEWGSGAHPDPARARAAAIGEALERYSAMFVPRELVRITTARELKAKAVPPSRFALFHPTQLTMSRFPCSPFTEDTRTAFVEGVSLTDGEPVYLPAELVYLARPAPSLRPVAYSTSSGLACAPTPVEGALAAALEVVERDAVMLAWKCALSLPLFDWSNDAGLVSLDRRFFGRSGLRFAVLDGSRFLDVPVAIAVVHGTPGSGAALAMGAGSAATIGEAWLKALAEGFGVYRWLRTQTADTPAQSEPDTIESFDDHMRYFAADERAELAAFLDASEERTATRDVRPLEGDKPRQQLDTLLRRLGAHGITAYAVDVTSPDVRSLGLAVVRVVVPELCALDASHRARFLGGRRLYTAAHQAGFLAAPLQVSELNALPHPFP
jgi:ribosomal protein S12 methylthiotransferase accessory factor